MTSPSRKIIKWGGVLAGSAAVASISAFATTKYLLKMAVDREEPKLMKLAEKRVAGFIEDDAFFKARIEAPYHEIRYEHEGFDEGRFA